MEAKKKTQVGITPDENLELRVKDDIEQQRKEFFDALDELDEAKAPASASPRPRKKEKKTDEGLMDFPDAMRAIIDGSTVSKKEWDNTDYKCRLYGNNLCIYKPDDSKWHPWLVSLGDMRGEDWFVV